MERRLAVQQNTAMHLGSEGHTLGGFPENYAPQRKECCCEASAPAAELATDAFEAQSGL